MEAGRQTPVPSTQPPSTQRRNGNVDQREEDGRQRSTSSLLNESESNLNAMRTSLDSVTKVAISSDVEKRAAASLFNEMWRRGSDVVEMLRQCKQLSQTTYEHVRQQERESETKLTEANRTVAKAAQLVDPEQAITALEASQATRHTVLKDAIHELSSQWKEGDTDLANRMEQMALSLESNADRISGQRNANIQQEELLGRLSTLETTMASDFNKLLATMTTMQQSINSNNALIQTMLTRNTPSSGNPPVNQTPSSAVTGLTTSGPPTQSPRLPSTRRSSRTSLTTQDSHVQQTGSPLPRLKRRRPDEAPARLQEPSLAAETELQGPVAMETDPELGSPSRPALTRNEETVGDVQSLLAQLDAFKPNETNLRIPASELPEPVLQTIRDSLVEFLTEQGNTALHGGLKGQQYQCARGKLHKGGQEPSTRLLQACSRCVKLRIVCVRREKGGRRPVLVPPGWQAMRSDGEWANPVLWREEAIQEL